MARSVWKLPLAAGGLLSLAYNFPLLVPNFVAFIPLMLWLDERDSGTRYDRIRCGLILGTASYLFNLHFLLALTRFTWLAVLLYVGFAVTMGIRISLFTMLIGWARQRTGLSWVVLLPACWLPFEWVQSFGDLRMTGEHIANSMTSYPFLVQFADVVGPYGVGAFVLVCNGLVYALWRGAKSERRRGWIAFATLIAVVLIYDAAAWRRHAPRGGGMRVAIVQPNIPLLVKHDPEQIALQQQRLIELSRRAAEEDPALIVWPETAWPEPLYHWLDRPRSYRLSEVEQLAQELGVSILAGIEYFRVRAADDYEMYNAAVIVHEDGRLDPNWMAKVYLVPFSEALPFRGLLGRFVEGKGGEWRWVAGGFEPGPRGSLSEVDGSKVGVLVCFEQLFADLARDLRNAGASFQVVVTNDAWFGRTIFQQYQARVLRMRAIETRSAFVRAANTGISGFVDRRGLFHQATNLYEEAVRVGEVEFAEGRTIYGRIGDVVAWLAVAGLAVVVVLGAFFPIRR
ncbi:MAG: apolipoprotein N-acyltransferase [bacterium]|nr:apolipoprotein N-acyltransferase [bacterium]